MNITIGHLYPDLLNLYGDRGNIQCLKKRCEWRGIRAEVKEFRSGDKVDFQDLDIVLLGRRFRPGADDRLQQAQGGPRGFQGIVSRSASSSLSAAAYSFLENITRSDDGLIEGLELEDLYTEQKEGRLISNIVLKSDLFDLPVVGFENHGGRTFIGANKPFGKVLYGNGNDGESGYEGVVYKNVIGTYLHGPLLPKNPQVADYLIRKALERKYNRPMELKALDDSEEKGANDYIYNRFVKKAE